MELAGPLALLQVSDPQLFASSDTSHSAASLESAKLNTALGDGQTVHPKTARFDDILGQTLAGPLFATWSPTPVIVPTAKSSATSANVAALDANGRRGGRKHSRR